MFSNTSTFLATLASNKSVTQITIPEFNASSADALVRYLTSSPMVNEQVWRLILQTLDSSMRKTVSFNFDSLNFLFSRC